MNRKSYWLLPVVLLILLVSSCTKDIPNVNRPENYVDGTFNDVFEAFWDGMNNNYVFWDIDTTDWNAMYTRYQPIFAKMNINDANDVKKSINYFRLMTQGLVDSHYNLSFSYESVADSSINPSYGRKMDTIHSLVDYYEYSIPYLNDVIGGEDNLTDPSQDRIAVAGTINDNILYFYCNMFELKSSYEASNNNDIKKVLDYFFAKLANPAGLKGVIIDVRGNPGGDVGDLNFLLGKMVSSPLTFGYTRYKSGNGRLDYTPWAPAIITPQAGAKGLNIPVVALADAWSVSLAELTTMAIHTMPNGKFIGERTWGANGPLSQNQNFNGGQFSVANFMYAYTSSSEFKYLDNSIYEGKGFPPDITVPFNEAALRQGRDAALEAAIIDILQ
jgi:carboxyl-terminal processing protease